MDTIHTNYQVFLLIYNNTQNSPNSQICQILNHISEFAEHFEDVKLGLSKWGTFFTQYTKIKQLFKKN